MVLPKPLNAVWPVRSKHPVPENTLLSMDEGNWPLLSPRHSTPVLLPEVVNRSMSAATRSIRTAGSVGASVVTETSLM